jgi:DNA ligase (NAD+)
MSYLKDFLRECQVAYYKGNPIISDDQYDLLEDLCNEEMPIGGESGRIKHKYPLYSLKKQYKDEHVIDNTAIYYVTPKLDGAAVAISYFNKTLMSVVTRGNGEYGEDITHLFTLDNCKKLQIPNEIEKEEYYQVIGEIVAPKYIPNARNYAAGALNLKDSNEFWTREITFFAYDLQKSHYRNYASTLAYLVSLGFQTVACIDTCDYPQDGEVYRIDCNKEYYNRGYTHKHPRGAYALKERSLGIETTIVDVVWQTGKSGIVTPVALLDPINIDGAQVSRATLNNPGFIEALGVEIGDKVMVERAGGIIPRIIKKAE